MVDVVQVTNHQVAAAVFDLDGMLVDSEPLWNAVMIKVFRRVGLQLSVEMCAETMGLRQRDMVRYWYERKPWSNVTVKEVEDQMIAEFCEMIHCGLRPLPGVEQTLEALHHAGLPLAVASSSPAKIILAVLKGLGIESWFQIIRSAEGEAHGKPAPDVYLSAARDLGVAPSLCLAFEDSPAGVRSALAAGMYVVAVPAATHWTLPVYDQACLKLRSLADFSLVHIGRQVGR